jgi:type IV pilus assembly protein PilV
MFRKTRLSRLHAGATMIEVLVTMAIVAFGLLGVGALMVTAIKQSYSSQQRSTATFIANSMIDRMRVNVAAANDTTGNLYDKPETSPSATAYTTTTTTCVSTSTTVAPTAQCTAAQTAQNDLAYFRTQVQTLLGNTAAVVVCRDSSSAGGSFDGTTITHGCVPGVDVNAFAVKIYWVENRGQGQTASPTYEVFVTRFSL